MMQKKKWGGQNKSPERVAIEDFLFLGGSHTAFEIAHALNLTQERVQKVLYLMTADHTVAKVPTFNENLGAWRYAIIGTHPVVQKINHYLGAPGKPTTQRITNGSQRETLDVSYLRDPAHVTPERMFHHRYAPSIVNGRRMYPNGVPA